MFSYPGSPLFIRENKPPRVRRARLSVRALAFLAIFVEAGACPRADGLFFFFIVFFAVAGDYSRRGPSRRTRKMNTRQWPVYLIRNVYRARLSCAEHTEPHSKHRAERSGRWNSPPWFTNRSRVVRFGGYRETLEIEFLCSLARRSLVCRLLGEFANDRSVIRPLH